MSTTSGACVDIKLLGQEYPYLIEIDAGGWVHALTFTTNGEYLLGGGKGGVGVWRVKDGERVATMTMQAKDDAGCVAVSEDGKWIAAGSDFYGGEVSVWDATSYERVFAHKIGRWTIYDVHFSPDSSRLVSADGARCTATIWDIAARKKAQTLDHGSQWVQAAKYSPQGDRIATASDYSIRVWDSDDGRLLVDIKVEVQPWHGLLWFNNHLFVKGEDGKIKQIDASTGSTVSEWSVPGAASCVALPQHEKFIACSTEDNITLWDTSTHTQLGLIPRSSLIRSIAFSPDDRLLASVVQERKIIIKNLSLIQEPDIVIENAALDAWEHGQLTNADALLTAAIPTSEHTIHHVLASRALVRARLQQWDAALVDVEESIKTVPSVVGYIAKCVALVGKGDTLGGYRVCDIAFQLHANHVTLFLLIKAVVLFMAGEHDDAILRMDDLITAVGYNPTPYVIQAYMYLLLGNLHTERGNYDRAIQLFENARVKLGDRTDQPPLIVLLISGWEFDDLAITIQQRLCEALFVAGRTKEAGESVLRMVDPEINVTEPIKTWVSDFMQRCLSTSENNDKASWVVARPDDAPTPREKSHALHPMMRLLREWARLRLAAGSWKDALVTGAGFMLPRFILYQVICERLEMTSHIADAVACFHTMCSELAQEIDGEQVNWTRDFKSRCCGKLEDIGDIAMNAGQYDNAILHYTAALSLNPATLQAPLVKRSKTYARVGEWQNALNDANKVIKLDPSSPLGYKRRHAALHGMGRHDDATPAFETMLLKMSQSSDPETRERSCRYVRPEKTKETIRTTIEDTIRDFPLVLINTASGSLCNKSEQVSAFEKTPIFTELISSMTTYIDNARIKQEVGKYFRYATFSHRWEENEPLYEKVITIVVYDLEASPTHEKLQMFCKIVREMGFNWAWSDTCCIDKGDHFVLQEALVSMFKWYEGSAMTIIFLRGVHRLALRGALMGSIWNKRAWTLQEYHASKAVRFYSEDWTPYLGLDIYNHKDSPDIVSEMEEATGTSARALVALRPGLDDIREKLRLASTRQTTRVEDAAYSLLGIFSFSLPIVYGEGDRALGRLLAQLLTSSGDVSILAWTGRSGSFNSCLPANIAVFRQLPTSHIPPAIPHAEMGTVTAELRSLTLTLATTLYDRLQELPVPLVAGRRIKLPCLAFKLGRVVLSAQNGPVCAFRARTNVLGVVEIRTKENLSQCGSLYLIHPWIDFLLNRLPVGNITETIRDEGAATKSSVTGELPSLPDLSSPTYPVPPDTASLSPPSTLSPVEKQTGVLQFIARLGQPFGALLLTRTRQNMEEYRRVATQSLITVQVEEITPAILDKLIQGVRMLDVL